MFNVNNGMAKLTVANFFRCLTRSVDFVCYSYVEFSGFVFSCFVEKMNFTKK